MRPGGVHSHAVSIVVRMSTDTIRRTLGIGSLVLVLLAGCAAEVPEVPLGPDGTPDPVLVQGREVFSSRCRTCHGSSGGGGTGPRLAGTVTETYPDPADQIAVVTNGRNGMPTFGGTLTDAEIEAVVRFTREVLE